MQWGVKQHPMRTVHGGLGVEVQARPNVRERKYYIDPYIWQYVRGWPFQGVSMRVHKVVSAWYKHGTASATKHPESLRHPSRRTVSPTHSPSARNDLRPYWRSLELDLRCLPRQNNIVAAVMM